MNLFVQTDNHIVDVEKIRHLNLGKRSLIVFFDDKHSVTLTLDEAKQLINGIDRLDRERKVRAIHG